MTAAVRAVVAPFAGTNLVSTGDSELVRCVSAPVNELCRIAGAIILSVSDSSIHYRILGQRSDLTQNE